MTPHPVSNCREVGQVKWGTRRTTFPGGTQVMSPTQRVHTYSTMNIKTKGSIMLIIYLGYMMINVADAMYTTTPPLLTP